MFPGGHFFPETAVAAVLAGLERRADALDHHNGQAARMRSLRAWPPGPVSVALPAGHVHVWLTAIDDGTERRVENLLDTLSADELARADRFRFSRDRQMFVVTRAVLRRLIGRYSGVAPSEVHFSYGLWGKPSLGVAGAGPEGLRFNVSHSGDLALLAFARGRDVGVDLERERPIPEGHAIAESQFSTRERAVLLRHAPAERSRAFLGCWTRKEALLKATGNGLSIPLDTFEVTLAPGEAAWPLQATTGPEEASRWSLVDLTPAPGFAAALAVEGHATGIACWTYDDHRVLSLERRKRFFGDHAAPDSAP